MWKAVYNSMRGTLQRRHTMQLLHLYDAENVPQDVLKNVTNQIRPLRPVPPKLHTFTKEQVDNFPKVMDYPKDYVLR